MDRFAVSYRSSGLAQRRTAQAALRKIRHLKTAHLGNQQNNLTRQYGFDRTESYKFTSQLSNIINALMPIQVAITRKIRPGNEERFNEVWRRFSPNTY